MFWISIWARRDWAFPLVIYPVCEFLGSRTDLPVSFITISMSSWECSFRLSASLTSTACRSATVDRDQAGSAFLAAVTASSSSSVVAMGQDQRGSSVRGSVTWWDSELPLSSSLMMLKNWGSVVEPILNWWCFGWDGKAESLGTGREVLTRRRKGNRTYINSAYRPTHGFLPR